MTTRFSLPLLDVKAGGAAGELSGYASTCGGPPDSHGDVVAAGAFRKSLERNQAEGRTVPLLWAHDQREPIGKWTSLREDDHGLFAVGKLSLGVQRAKDAFELARDGCLSLSIGYTPRRARAEKGYQVLEEIDLAEISVVAVPANSRAKILSVKSLSGLSIREFERVLRDTFDLSSREAKRLSMGGYKALCGDDPSTELSEIAAELRRSATRFQR